MANAYIDVLADLGGESVSSCRGGPIAKDSGPRDCSVTIEACPWDNGKARNVLLCVLCRGIAGRFASKSKTPIGVELRKSMADGEKRCLVVITEEKD